MARFYVGQRVKLVRPLHPRNMNETGTVADFQCFAKGTLGRRRIAPIDCNIGIRWDGDGVIYSQHTEQLEPLTPPHQPADADFTERLNEQFREIFHPDTVKAGGA